MAIEAEERAKTQSEHPEAGVHVPPMHAGDHSHGDPVIETPVEARQGFLGKPVLIVLIAGLVLAVLAGIAVGYIPV